MPCLGAPGAAAVEVSRDDGRRPRWIKARQWAADQGADTMIGQKLAVRREPPDIATGRFVNGRRVAGRRLATDHSASRIVVRRRAAAVGRRPSAALADDVVRPTSFRR